MSLPAVIADFATGTYTVTRRGQGSYTNGRYVAAASSEVDIEACVQPASGRELRMLAEAAHSDSVKVIYTATQLYTRTPTQSPDVVEIDSEDYEVIKVETWEAFGDTHYVAYASLITEQPDQELEMQNSQEQSFQYETTSETDSYDVTLPVEMADDSYVVARPSITTLPDGGVLCDLYVADSSKTTTGFTLTCGYPLKVGTVIDFVVRDHE